MEDSLIIVIPAYNEEETIRDVLEEWYTVLEQHPGDGKSRLLVINDGSRDHTEQILEKFQQGHPMMLYRTQKNGGHGAAIWNGYAMALRTHADYIFQTDSDGQTSPDEFEQFWEKRRIDGVVTGKRINREDGCSRTFVSRVLRILILCMFHANVQDANCPYRLMGREALQDALRMVPRRYHLTNVILSAAFVKQGKPVFVLPIRFRKRQGGTNSVNIRKIIKMGLRSLGEFRVIEKHFHGSRK